MSPVQAAVEAPTKGLFLKQCPTIVVALAKSIIKDHKVEKLKDLCRQCGISSAGTKLDMANRLAQACVPLPSRPWRIVSIDIGIYNFAKATLQVDLAGPSHSRPRLVEWEKISIDLAQTTDPRSMATMMAGLVNELKRNEEKTPAKDDYYVEYLIERQTFRGGGNKMIPGIVQKINMIENQLHCFLLQERTICVDPRAVAFLYSFRTGARKKRDAINLVSSFISAQALGKTPPTHKVHLMEFAPEWTAFFKRQEKKDDLADALLQALAHYRWRLNMAKLWDKYQPNMEKEIRASEF